MTNDEHDTPTTPAKLYECDVCGAKVPRDEIATVWAYGIEIGACLDCRNAREN